MPRMKNLPHSLLAALCASIAMGSPGSLSAVEPQVVIPLWPGLAPGDKEPLAAEQDTTKPTDNLIAGKTLIRLGNVSKPSISVYQASSANQPRPAVVVCPGGAYQILALDLG